MGVEDEGGGRRQAWTSAANARAPEGAGDLPTGSATCCSQEAEAAQLAGVGITPRALEAGAGNWPPGSATRGSREAEVAELAGVGTTTGALEAAAADHVGDEVGDRCRT